jgi:hypothetical protein
MMNWAKRGLASAVVIFGLLSVGRAESLDLSYEAVMHVREVHAVQIFDDPQHVVGVGVFRGLAKFPDGEIAVHRYEGWFDLTRGSGTYHGYASWRFPDGSELRARYRGTVDKVSEDRFDIRATLDDLTGTMRFDGATGTGTFEGRRIEALEVGGATYLNGSLDIRTSR